MKRILICIAFLCCCIISQAQGINGRVVAENVTPVDGANVVLMRCDSSFVDIMITDCTGCFSFGHRLEKFNIVVQHLAFAPLQQTFDCCNVGDIQLTSVGKALK